MGNISGLHRKPSNDGTITRLLNAQCMPGLLRRGDLFRRIRDRPIRAGRDSGGGMRRVYAAGLALVGSLVLASSASAGGYWSAHHWCRPFQVRRIWELPNVEKGSHVTCAAAQRIFHTFNTGNRGRPHGAVPGYPPTDLANTYWIVDGWKCETHAGSSICSHGGREQVEERSFSPSLAVTGEIEVELRAVLDGRASPAELAVALEVEEREAEKLRREEAR